jgi:hypothetical protein
MILGATYEQSLATRKHYFLPNGTGFWKTDFITSAHDALPSPQAFLVEQDPNQVILPHFHEQNQFQIIVQGGGTLGRAIVAPITVHYAAAFTGYGPITSGDEGLWYFTFRPMMDNGALFVHESRDKMKPGPKKHYHSEPFGATPESELAELRKAEIRTIHADPTGPTIAIIRMPPGQPLPVSEAGQGGGQYLLVTSGSLVAPGALHSKWSCIWIGNGDDPLQGVAGEQGAEVLRLEFPRTEYRATYVPGKYKYAD